MSKKTSSLDQFQAEISETSRELWLTGLGAVATLTEEGNKLWHEVSTYFEGDISLEKFRTMLEKEQKILWEKGLALQKDLMKKGEKLEKEQQKNLNEWVDTLKSKGGKFQENVEETLENPMEHLYEPIKEKVSEVLEDIDFPSREEFTSFSTQLSTLVDKVDKLATAIEKEEAPKKTTRSRAKK